MSRLWRLLTACILISFQEKEDEDDKENVKEENDEDPGKLEEESWGGGRNYRQGMRDGRSGHTPTFRAYSSEEYKRDSKFVTLLSTKKSLLQCVSLHLFSFAKKNFLIVHMFKKMSKTTN